MRIVESLAEPILLHEGFELVDITYRNESHGWVLRVFIDRERGVTLDDCSRISRQLSDILDVKDVIPQSYSLEVSSPGVNRPLRKERDFEKYRGETVRVKAKPQAGNRKNFKGVLHGLRDGNVILCDEDREYVVPFESVVKAQVEYDFDTKKK